MLLGWSPGAMINCWVSVCTGSACSRVVSVASLPGLLVRLRVRGWASPLELSKAVNPAEGPCLTDSGPAPIRADVSHVASLVCKLMLA